MHGLLPPGCRTRPRGGKEGAKQRNTKGEGGHDSPLAADQASGPVSPHMLGQGKAGEQFPSAAVDGVWSSINLCSVPAPNHRGPTSPVIPGRQPWVSGLSELAGHLPCPL